MLDFTHIYKLPIIIFVFVWVLSSILYTMAPLDEDEKPISRALNIITACFMLSATLTVILTIFWHPTVGEVEISKMSKPYIIKPSEMTVTYQSITYSRKMLLTVESDNDKTTPPEKMEFNSDELYINGKHADTYPDIKIEEIKEIKVVKVKAYTKTSAFGKSVYEPSKPTYKVEITLNNDEKAKDFVDKIEKGE